MTLSFIFTLQYFIAASMKSLTVCLSSFSYHHVKVSENLICFISIVFYQICS